MHVPKKYYGFVYHCCEEGWDCTHASSIFELQFTVKVSNSSSRRRCNPSACSATRKPLMAAAGVRGWFYESKCKKHLIHMYLHLKRVLDILKRRGTS